MINLLINICLFNTFRRSTFHHRKQQVKNTFDQVDGLEYYSCKLDECDEAVRTERNTIRTKRCNFAFVVWTSPGNCKMLVNLN